MAGYKMHRGGDAWRLEVTLGTDFTGKRQRYIKTVHCPSARAADKELALFIAECEEGTFTGRSGYTTVAQLMQLYHDEHVVRFLKRSYQMSLESMSKTWIIPYLGNRKVNALKKIHIQQWVNFMSDQGKNPKTVANVFSAFRKMLDFAVDMEIIRDNPCKNVRLPKSETSGKPHSYDRCQVSVMVHALDQLPESDQVYKVFILLALFGGFRKGEILGFDWADIDLETGTINVIRTRNDGRKGDIYIDSPKTIKSQRSVVLPSYVLPEIKRLRKIQMQDQLMFGQAYKNSPAMLRSEDGAPINPQKPYKWFVKFCNNNELPALGLHSLRHTHASLLANLGADKVTVSNRLGHSQLSTTLNIYTHLFESPDESLAHQLDLFAKEI